MDTAAQTRVLDEAVYQYSTLTAADQLERLTKVVSFGVLGAIAGDHVREFEQQVAGHLGRQGAVATSSASAALELLLRCLPQREAAERVVIPEVCWISVPAAVLRSGRTPVIAPATSDLTPHWEQIEPLLDARTTVVILAHMRGRPAPDTQRIADELAQRGITFIEDCAQAWGVTLDKQPVGRHGLAAVFSTETHKLVATGEGGVIAADDSQLLHALRAVGGNTRIALPENACGRGNDRMSEITAASALPQLIHLDVLQQTLRPLQDKLIDRFQDLSEVRRVLPTMVGESPNLGTDASNGSLVGVWLPTSRHANRVADRLFRLGVRHWWPGPGDPHLAENWPSTPTTTTRCVADMACYLDIQVPVLDESQHPAFLDLLRSALRLDDNESESA
ncbi:DegT/DnrJ/EryC1/StrS family aminotransferase [Pseudonocardia sp. C8]|uniref:DegT/DnrJ/EryC1/StrS family aminotransferase n=1 Tax=Saccharopolyspora cebuensis TaxID=418759 RepID=A0ABV4CQT0_9PSEU|nr:DegT/DnrJ/EryC1/StrS family aminotransferase [Pseudonocardia sp. C8]MBC3194017.1 DegT/DnrJ/EryC1/StrS family aminotransferase [Pseudonocardia sp. C8]